MASWDDTPLVKDLIDQRPKTIYGECCYCGRPCVGQTCDAHRDLIGLDPNEIAWRGVER